MALPLDRMRLAVEAFVLTGRPIEAARASGRSKATINGWRKRPEWASIEAEVRAEQKRIAEAETDAKVQTAAEAAAERQRILAEADLESIRTDLKIRKRLRELVPDLGKEDLWRYLRVLRPLAPIVEPTDTDERDSELIDPFGGEVEHRPRFAVLEGGGNADSR